MADLTLHKDNSNAATIISNHFIDEYMINANGEFVKIYLYLLRCMNSPDCSFSISKAADTFNHTEKDIQRALKYWEKMNLLQLEYTEDKSIAGIYFLDSEAVAPKDDTVPLKKAPAVSANISASVHKEAALERTTRTCSAPQTDSSALPTTKKPVYSADELRTFREKEEVQELMFVAESYLARPLTPTDIQTLLSWYDWLAFSNDLIEYLMEYCIAGGHPSLHYMDKVAINWKHENIRTVEQAKRNAQEHSKLHYAVLKALGIQGRSLVPAEFSYVEKWCKEYGFDQDIITEACSRTILSIHQPNFDYTDRILTNWKRQNIKTMADIRKADEAFQAAKTTERARLSALKGNPIKPASANRFNSFPQRTYNMDELEAELLAR
ncbi:MAG: DnaD domain protein [Lachnospiraceae bacterium]|nr:DnaD domain protein [Lachnospiraceae bacterium]